MRRKKITWYQWFLGSWLYLMLIWLLVGFAVGTLTLLFPLRTWVNYVRENDLDDSIENIGVVVMMLLLAVISFIIAWRLFKWHLSKKSRIVTISSFALPFASTIGALALFMNPDFVNKGSESAELSRQFTVGPYPTSSKIEQLKKQGYTGIISLLHPAVVPFEPRLLKAEEEAAKQLGIQLVKAPMLPWIGDNTASLKKIEDLVKTEKGKYYIHCYLGKDRVNVVKNLIAKLTGGSSIESEISGSHRTFETAKSFERGPIYKLADDVYMTPFPTDEEFLSFFLAGKVSSVVNILSDTKENREWVNKELTELQKSKILFRYFPIKEESKGKEVLKVVEQIYLLPRPIVIHRWNTHSTEAQLFRKIFSTKTGKAPVNLATNDPETY